VIIGGNPAYNAPADLKFADLCKAATTTINLSDYHDETAQLCQWHINRAHYLEAWGDGRSCDGTYSIAQPLIEAMFGGKSAIELLAAITADDQTSGYEIVRRTSSKSPAAPMWSALAQGAARWRCRRERLACGHRRARQRRRSRPADAGLQQRWSSPRPDELEAVFVQDLSVHDGRFANNAGFRRCPTPSPSSPGQRGAYEPFCRQVARPERRRHGQREMRRARCDRRRHDLPGQYPVQSRSRSATAARSRAASARAPASTSTNSAAPIDGFAAASVAKASGSYELATTQDHHPVDTVGAGASRNACHRCSAKARWLNTRRSATLRSIAPTSCIAFRFGRGSRFQTHDPAAGAKYAWGMSIDLNACTGFATPA